MRRSRSVLMRQCRIDLVSWRSAYLANSRSAPTLLPQIQFFLPGGPKFPALIDDEKMTVTIISIVFDSSLIDWMLTNIFPDDHKVVAFRDDDAGWNPKRPPYSLRIRIGGNGGQEFAAGAARLATAKSPGREVAITLAPTTTRDADVTDLKRMFGEAKKVVSIVEMNA